jgi:hypothetical protein
MNTSDIHNNTNPRKHKYVKIKTPELFAQLVTLYTHLLQVNWIQFSLALDSCQDKNTTYSSAPAYAAAVYVSHWFHDSYCTLRSAVQKIDPIAFGERFSREEALYNDRYDHFHATLNAHIRPTHVIGIGDHVYIPYFADNQYMCRASPFPGITAFIIDMTVFQIVHQTLEIRKLVRMTPLSSDPTGCPSWLFDWFDNGTAYSWFQQEGNYNDVHTTVAYIIRIPMPPKLGFCDVDEWSYYPFKTSRTSVYEQHNNRVSARRWTGLAETRVIESQYIPLPNYYETDETKFKGINIGPLRLLDKNASSYSASSAETEVLSLPRPVTTDKDKNKDHVI